ncbi:MAG: hypothetical protein RLN62_05620 [Rickettsiales bacterium]
MSSEEKKPEPKKINTWWEFAKSNFYAAALVVGMSIPGASVIAGGIAGCIQGYQSCKKYLEANPDHWLIAKVPICLFKAGASLAIGLAAGGAASIASTVVGAVTFGVGSVAVGAATVSLMGVAMTIADKVTSIGSKPPMKGFSRFMRDIGLSLIPGMYHQVTVTKNHDLYTGEALSSEKESKKIAEAQLPIAPVGDIAHEKEQKRETSVKGEEERRMPSAEERRARREGRSISSTTTGAESSLPPVKESKKSVSTPESHDPATKPPVPAELAAPASKSKASAASTPAVSHEADPRSPVSPSAIPSSARVEKPKKEPGRSPK